MSKRKMSGSILYLAVLGLLFFAIGLLTALHSGFSPTDIGELLAGAATLLGVLAAYLAAQKWKEQKNHDMQMAFYKEFFQKIETLRSHLHRHIPEIERVFKRECEDGSNNQEGGMSIESQEVLSNAILDLDVSIGNLRESECWVAVFAGNGEPLKHIQKLIESYRVLYQILKTLQKGMKPEAIDGFLTESLQHIRTLNHDIEVELTERHDSVEKIASLLQPLEQADREFGLDVIVRISELRLDKIVRQSIETCAYNMGLEQLH